MLLRIRTYGLFSLLVFCAQPLLAAAVFPTDRPADLQGTVTDPRTGTPIVNATVTILDADSREVLASGIRTDLQGMYSVHFTIPVGVEEETPEVSDLMVRPAYPNPVRGNGRVVVPYNGPEPMEATFDLFDALGRQVAPRSVLAPGVYFYRVRQGSRESKAQALTVTSAGPVEVVLQRIPAIVDEGASKNARAVYEVVCIVEKDGFVTHESLLNVYTGITNKHDVTLAVPSDRLSLGVEVDAGSKTIRSEGGTFTVNKNGTPVDDLKITTSYGSFDSDVEFHVSYAPITSHDFGPNFNPVSPLIRIRSYAGYADNPVTLFIPADIPRGHFAMAFAYDETTGKLEGLPPISLDDDGVMVTTRRMGPAGAGKKEGGAGLSVVVASMSESAMALLPDIATGFTPGVDDWEFPNNGSYVEPDGHCAGQVITAAWYYFERKLGTGAPALYGAFDESETLWQDNGRGYRLASTAQSTLQWDGWLRDKLFEVQEGPNAGMISWKAFILSMLVTGEPQYVGVRRPLTDGNFAGHALLAYGVSPSRGLLYIADPNYPGQARTIPFASEVLGPYDTKQNATETSTKSYPEVRYFAKTALIDWSTLGELYTEFEDKTIGNAVFPDYAITYRDADDRRVEMTDFTGTYNIDTDTLKLEVRCASCAQQLSGTDRLQSIEVYDTEGTLIARAGSSNKGMARVPLKPGLNRIGVYVTGAVNQAAEYVDFLWIDLRTKSTTQIVARPVDGAPLKVPGRPNTEYTFAARLTGARPTGARYEWDWGDDSGLTIVQDDTTAGHMYAQPGSYQIRLKVYGSGATPIAEAEALANIGSGTGTSGTFSSSYDSGNGHVVYCDGTYTIDGAAVEIDQSYHTYNVTVPGGQSITFDATVVCRHEPETFETMLSDRRYVYTYQPPHLMPDDASWNVIRAFGTPEPAFSGDIQNKSAHLEFTLNQWSQSIVIDLEAGWELNWVSYDDSGIQNGSGSGWDNALFVTSFYFKLP